MKATDLRRHEKKTLRGFFNLKLSNGLTLLDCSWHCQGDSEWIGLPGKPHLDRDGKQRRDAITQKPMYLPVIQFEDKAIRDKFTAAALAALHEIVTPKDSDPVFPPQSPKTQAQRAF
jgi:hypothetical protein